MCHLVQAGGLFAIGSQLHGKLWARGIEQRRHGIETRAKMYIP